MRWGKCIPTDDEEFVRDHLGLHESNLLAALAALSVIDMAAAADIQVGYQLSPGDTVEIGIASISDRMHRAVVQMDGTIALPDPPCGSPHRPGNITASTLHQHRPNAICFIQTDEDSGQAYA